jgi:hypothetical protein
VTSVIEGVGGRHHVPAALPPRKTRFLLYRRLGGLQSQSGRVRKISPPPRFDPRTVQPVANRYTGWAIPALGNVGLKKNCLKKWLDVNEKIATKTVVNSDCNAKKYMEILYRVCCGRTVRTQQHYRQREQYCSKISINDAE